MENSNDLKKENLIFTEALKSDIKGIADIEQEYFGDYYKAFNENNLTEWYDHNQHMFYVVKENEGTVVLAFLIFVPVNENLYDKIKRAEVSELLDFDKIEVPKDLNLDYIFIADVCATLKYGKDARNVVASVLLSGTARLLAEHAKGVVTKAINPDAEKRNKLFGFNNVIKAPDGFPIMGFDGEREVLEKKCERIGSLFK